MPNPARKLRVPPSAPLAIHDRAIENLRFIRETMERSTSFTHVSGIGVVAMGIIALLASWLSSSVASRSAWLLVWLGAAALSFTTASWLMARKSRASGIPLLAGPGRKFAWTLTPPLLVGLGLTLAYARAGLFDLVPATWLLLYGTGVIAAGSHSVRAVPVMGVAFLSLGGVALFAPSTWGGLLLAVGFGGMHVLFGAYIWRRHGG